MVSKCLSRWGAIFLIFFFLTACAPVSFVPAHTPSALNPHGAGAASIRLYRESALDPGLSGRVEVPTAILMPLRDGVTVPAPREWAERSFNVKRWTIMERGGHFPEWEVPHEVANDIRLFFSEVT